MCVVTVQNSLRKHDPEHPAFGQMGQSSPKHFSGFIDKADAKVLVLVLLLFLRREVVKRRIGKQNSILFW